MENRGPEIYREAFRETVNPAVIADTDLVITDVNEAAREFTGYSREELVGATPRRLVADEAVYAEIVETVGRGDPWIGEFESLTSDGRLVHGRGSVSPLVFDGRVEGYVTVFTDMTRRRRYEESLRILNRVLRHNLRNDANVVLGHIERVADEVADSLDAEETAGLLDSLDTAAGRVDDMLDRARTTRRFSGVLAGETGSLRPVDLASAVAEAVRDAPTGDVAVDNRATEPVSVLADGTLVPALYAVVENAIEHNDKARPRVVLSAAERDGRVVLSVADNGPGIDPARHDEIFGYGEHTQVEHGEGLSLFFVDRLLEMYGGGIAVRSNEPEGTVFELTFRRPDADGSASCGGATDAGRTDAGPSEPVVDWRRSTSARTDQTTRARARTRSRTDGSRSASGRRPPTDGVGNGRGGRPGGPDADTDAGTSPSAAGSRDVAGSPSVAGPSPAAGPPGSRGTPTTAEPADLIRHSEGRRGSPADDPAVAATADAVGPSVTPARLRGDARGYPAVLDALDVHDQPHHLLRLRPATPVDDGGDRRLRGTAAAVLTDAAAVVVVDGAEGGRLSIPYRSLTAVGRRPNALVLDAGPRTYRLLLPRAHAADDEVDAAVAFLEREIR